MCSLLLGLLVLAVLSISTGGGSLEYDVIECPVSEGEVDATRCYWVRGHGFPWVWIELESVMEWGETGDLESVSVNFERILCRTLPSTSPCTQLSSFFS